MKKMNITLIILLFISLVTGFLAFIPGNRKEAVSVSVTDVLEPAEEVVDPVYLLFGEMQLEGVVNYEAFRQAVTGFHRIEGRSKDILALVDFSLPSTAERLFVFDLDKKEVLFVTHVSHGRNSGGNYATSFSNVNGSYQSSPGFYLTEHTYQGKNGYSLVLDGLEAGINDRAKERAIVMHGAAYSNPSSIATNGRLGRSLGCPAVPEAMARPVIDTLKEGAILFIYTDQADYLLQSDLLS